MAERDQGSGRKDIAVLRKRMAWEIRVMSRHRDVLFHGTRSLREIVGEDRLRRSPSGHIAVSFTRSAEIAVHWALLARDGADETAGVIVLDRAILKAHHCLEPFHDPIWDDAGSTHDEAEERIIGRDVTGLSTFLVGIVRLEGYEPVLADDAEILYAR